MRIAGLQHDITWEDPEATCAHVAPMIADAVAGGAELVLLTEMFATGFSLAADRIAEPPGGPTETFLTDRAADIIGPNIQLHHTKMFIKPPAKGAPFPMHQDFPYFPHQHHTMIAAIIHFDDAPIEKGCVRVVPGSHKLGPLEHLHDGGHHLPIDEYPITEATPCPAEAGDVLFFSYLTIHGSGLNESSEARTTLLLQLRDPADLPTVETHVSRGQGMILHGIDPLANSGPSPDSALRLKVAPCT